MKIILKTTENEIDFCFARDLQYVFRYSEWRNFQKVIIKAKDFATEITVFNTKEKDLKTEKQISSEHITNNQGVRDILLKKGIKLEELL